MGESGPKTESAILDFRNRNNLPQSPNIDGDLLNSLLIAAPKVLPVLQTTATSAEIAPKIEAVKSNLWTKFVAKVTAVPAVVGGAIVGSIQYLGDAINFITPVKVFLSEWLDGVDKLTLVAVFAAVIALVSGMLWYNSRSADAAMQEGYRGGTLKDDNKEARQ